MPKRQNPLQKDARKLQRRTDYTYTQALDIIRLLQKPAARSPRELTSVAEALLAGQDQVHLCPVYGALPPAMAGKLRFHYFIGIHRLGSYLTKDDCLIGRKSRPAGDAAPDDESLSSASHSPIPAYRRTARNGARTPMTAQPLTGQPPRVNKKQRLNVAAYLCTPQLLDGAAVVVREFDNGFKNLWRGFDRAYKDLAGREEVQAPHSIVTTALRCLTGGYVHFDPWAGVLVTRVEIDDDTLRDAFTLMVGMAMGTPIDQISLNNPDPLAVKVASTPEERRLLADYLITNENGQPDAPGWVYRTVTWDLSIRLAARPWKVDGQEITLRPDSEGGLIAWGHPWSNKNGTAHAVARIRLSMKTLPNLSHPVILASSQVTRLKSSLAYARKVLVEQADPGLPLIEVELDGRAKIRRINRMALQILSKLGMDYTTLSLIQNRAQAEADYDAATQDTESGEGEIREALPPIGPDSKIRPIQGKSYKFPIGRGVGMHHMRELDRHIRDVFGDAATSPDIHLSTRGFPRNDPKNPLPAPAEVTRSLTSMGYEHLRIVCLWSKDENRTRMINGLCDAYSLPATSIDPSDGVPVPLHGDTVSVVFHHAPAFLAHGPATGRAGLVDGLPSLRREPGTLVAVWAETEYTAESIEDTTEEEAAENRRDRRLRAKNDESDAKYQGRRIIAQRGIVSQYIADMKQTKRKRDQGKDHQALYSLVDLHRNIGILDERIDTALIDPIGAHAPHGVAHVGIHVRRQSKQHPKEKAKICITAVALVPPSVEGGAWTLHGWSYTNPKWQHYNDAIAAFHALDYPTGKMTELVDDNQGYKKVAEQIDQALSDLTVRIGRLPYTVTVDGVGTRRLWGGLHNNKQGLTGDPGDTWLPGSTLRHHDRPIAVIRINKSADEVPQPISVSRFDADGNLIGANSTTTSLYRLDTDLGPATWILSNVPHQYDGNGAGRLGGDKTRWTAGHGSKEKGNISKNEVAANWYTMNGTEIYPLPLTPGVGQEVLANLTARLCNRPLAWSNRTRYPVHLHAAQQMDLDHPQYRRTAPQEDNEAEATGDAQQTADQE
ncbi:RNaseH domain-containing protein [Streptomyces sp. NPDC006984]|uniref:RNaseH domain-containing protein n=1 Tax=Streptomyces sp. NPDC006984 TaxID=3155463 RepID=UPI0033C04727